MIYILIALCLVLHVADMFQTIVIAKNPDKWHEKNPLIGPYPTPERVKKYFALTAATLAPVMLLGYWTGYTRSAWLIGLAWLAVQVWAVVNNWKIGIRVTKGRL